MTGKPIDPPSIDETAIAEQAARWHAALQTAGPEELAGLSAWLRMSPRHGHHLLYATTLDRLLDHIDPAGDKFDPRAWVRDAQENVVAMHSGQKPVARPVNSTFADPASSTPTDQVSASNTVEVSSPIIARNLRNIFTSTRIAASVLVALCAAVGFALLQDWGWKELATRTGEQRTIELQDGSIVHLNTATRLRVHLTDNARDIRLEDGEALFKVHRDASRPFRVHAFGSIIQAVGTQFNVHRNDDMTQVSVLEGAVRISADTPPTTFASSNVDRSGAGFESARAASITTSLTAGQTVEINPSGQVRARPATDVARVTAWQQRRLVFQADALADMVAEFNRYNRTPKFRLEGIDGHARHYTGTFDADDPQSFATVLAQENVYAVERTANEILIRAR